MILWFIYKQELDRKLLAFIVDVFVKSFFKMSLRLK